MTQTTNSIYGGAAYVGISINGSAWTDISGHSNKVSPGGGDRNQGKAYTFDGEYPIVKVGKMNERQTRIDLIYTEQSGDAYEIARGQFIAAGGGTMYARWAAPRTAARSSPSWIRAQKRCRPRCARRVTARWSTP